MKVYPYGRQNIDAKDIKAVVAVLKSDYLTQGPWIEKFEKSVSAYCGSRYAVAFSSATAALHGASFAAGIGKGDDIITSPFTFAASANCVLYLGGNVRFVDTREDIPIIDPENIARAITKNTKAIISIDYSGLPVDYEKIASIARKNSLIFISDAAHSIGSTYKQKKIGTLADMSIFSFHPVKAITTGEGGMVVTNNKDYYEKLQLFRSHGITKNEKQFERSSDGPWYYEMQALGYNYRMTDIQAALGNSQLKKLDVFIKARQEIAAEYERLFFKDNRISTIKVSSDRTSAWHIYPIFLNTHSLIAHKRDIVDALHKAGVKVQIHYIPVHLHPYYQHTLKFKKGDFKISESFYDREISLPMYPGLSRKDQQVVVKLLTKVLDTYS